MSSLKALCEIDETTIAHGLGYKDPKEYGTRSITLHGETIEYWDKKNCIRPQRSTKDYDNFFNAEVNFVPDLKESGRFDLYGFDSTLYIGELSLKTDKKGIHVGAYFDWSLSYFLYLCSMKDKTIEMKITFHENESKNVGRNEHIIGLIKIVEF